MFGLFSTYTFVFGPIFLLFVVLLGSLMVWVAETSRLAPSFQSRSGIVAPFGNVPAVLFGLIVAFTGQEIWANNTRAETAVAREADAIRVVRSLAGALGERGEELDRLVVSYVKAATAGDWRSPPQVSHASALISQMLHHSLFGAVAQDNPQVQRTILESIAEIRTGHRERIAAGKTRTTGMKWIGAFVLGILTQMAIVLSHLGRPRASRMAVTLFSLCMGFVLWTALVRIDVFSGKYGTSLFPIIATAAAP